MRIAFYAPMKAPTHPSPSGDRRIAQLLWRALKEGGNEVTLASDFRAYEGMGDGEAQTKIAQEGGKIVEALVAGWQDSTRDVRPELWFSYHLYHKAPDWLGPAVAQALNIPYVAAEASYAHKQARGSYALGLDASLQAIARADAILSFTPEDEEALTSLVKHPACLHRIVPFLDPAPYCATRSERRRHRAEIAERHGLDITKPWLLTVAMMRGGDKLASYRLLARALNLIADPPWQLLIAGDGPARASVEEALYSIGREYVFFAGQRDEEELMAYYAASDLFVWPAYNEAYGMALLEAAASGLPVVAGDWRGVSEIVADAESGVLIGPWDDVDFAEAVHELTTNDMRRRTMAKTAAARVKTLHGIGVATACLNHALAAAQDVHKGVTS